MIHIEIHDENKITWAQQLGHQQNLQDTVEKAVEMYLQYLKQQAIIQEFGAVDLVEGYDYKKQRGV